MRISSGFWPTFRCGLLSSLHIPVTSEILIVRFASAGAKNSVKPLTWMTSKSFGDTALDKPPNSQ